ncbi:hypothetical protein DPMN_059861 [Dreissena polymorpha]|uniref:Uncharacterized protein n=1 Tax=Dreissena polymorpha TaxID=45954 RepID=A0A9D4C462_DREPO|nr:hypothetical protein DPMN_059861 [Dreissena polymorpha]
MDTAMGQAVGAMNRTRWCRPVPSWRGELDILHTQRYDYCFWIYFLMRICTVLQLVKLRERVILFEFKCVFIARALNVVDTCKTIYG